MPHIRLIIQHRFASTSAVQGDGVPKKFDSQELAGRIRLSASNILMLFYCPPSPSRWVSQVVAVVELKQLTEEEQRERSRGGNTKMVEEEEALIKVTNIYART